MTDIQKKAIMYIRVSTEEQLENFSLKTQEEICKKEAAKRGYSIDKVFREEGKSAKSITGRPTLIKLMEYCRNKKRKIGALIVYRLDRISRDTADYLAIRKKLTEYGVSIISATEPTGESPTEKLIETILAGFAQLDNDIRAERSRNGMHTRFLSGLPNGNPPAGYIMVDGYVVKDKNCYEYIKKAWDLMATGTKSLREMAEILNALKLKNARTGKMYSFRMSSVHRIFRSKFYIGVIKSRKYNLEAQGQHIPMISKEQFLKVQEILDGRNRNILNITLRNRNNEDFPLRRFIKCIKCKKGFTASWCHGRLKKYAYYHCHSACKNSFTPRKIIHDSFAKLLSEKVLKQEHVTLYLFILRKVFEKRYTIIKQKQTRTEFQIRKLKEQKQTLIDKNLSGIYSDKDFKEQFDLIEERLKAILAFNSQESLIKYTKEEAQRYIEKILSDLPTTYEMFDIKLKRTFISLFFPKGLIWTYPGLKEIA